MPNNYPPGVTGCEKEIIGESWIEHTEAQKKAWKRSGCSGLICATCNGRLHSAECKHKPHKLDCIC